MNRKLSILIVFMSIAGLAVAYAAPASAEPGPVSPAVIMEFRGQEAHALVARDGWGVFIETAVRSAPGDCAYVEAVVVVREGNDPDRRLQTSCGGAIERRTLTIRAGLGTGIDRVVLRLCRDELIDSCASRRVAVPDYASSTTAQQRQAAVRILGSSMRRFQALNRDEPAPYDWTDDTDDGAQTPCSAPSRIPSATTWSRRFAPACQRHDFGYRNLGKTRWWATDNVKRMVDLVFLSDMEDICEDHDWRGCSGAAGAFYLAVSACGGAAFYGQNFRPCRI